MSSPDTCPSSLSNATDLLLLLPLSPLSNATDLLPLSAASPPPRALLRGLGRRGVPQRDTHRPHRHHRRHHRLPRPPPPHERLQGLVPDPLRPRVSRVLFHAPRRIPLHPPRRPPRPGHRGRRRRQRRSLDVALLVVGFLTPA